MKNWQAFVASNLDERTRKEFAMKDSGRSAEVRKDFFHYLFDARDPETGQPGYKLAELWGECELLTIAGSDTTAIVMAATTFYLARNAGAQAKLAREILAAFSSLDEIVAGPKLHACNFLRAFIQETLRMAPPVPAELAREVLPGGTTVHGAFLPADVKVSTCLYCLSYNAAVFAQPFTFRPERFLLSTEDPMGDSAAEVARAESGLCAFSTGSRGCVGRNMAWMEMQILLAKLVFSFELRQDPEEQLGGGSPMFRPGRRDTEQYQIYDAFVAMRDGPMIQFRERV